MLTNAAAVKASPAAAALAWAAQAVGPGAEVTGSRRLVGGIMSSVHALSVIDGNARRHRVVLRRWVGNEAWMTTLVEREAAILEALERTSIPAPRLVAADPTGAATGGIPALLMTRMTGQVLLEPRDLDSWLAQTASVLPVIHATLLEAPAVAPWNDRVRPAPWSQRADLWGAAVKLLTNSAPPDYERCFIHRDFQHFNLLWSRQRLTGVIDWASASTGSPDIDVGHCRLNLAVLFSAEVAERFRLAYEAAAGRRVDPWWTILSLFSYGEEWPGFIPIQVGRRGSVDTKGMHDRVDHLLEVDLRRM